MEEEKITFGQRIGKWFFAVLFIIIIVGSIIECGDRTHRATSSFLYDSEKYD
jgi:hypothetical protein